MRVTVAVSMPTAAATSSAMRMTMMAARRGHADQVDRKSDGTDGQELSRVHLWRVDEALDRLKDDKDGDEAEEDAVGKAGERLDARVTIERLWSQVDSGETTRKTGQGETHP